MEGFENFEEINEFAKEVCKKSENLKSVITEFNEKLKEIQIENNKWSVEVGDELYVINTLGNIHIWKHLGDCDVLAALKVGNAFKTKKEAEFELERRKVLAELNKYNCIYYPRFKDKETSDRAFEEVGEERIKKYLLGVEE